MTKKDVCDVPLEKRTFEWCVKKHLITMSMLTDPMLIGSGSLLNFIFFNDIDTMERIHLGKYKSQDEAIAVFVPMLRAVISRISLHKEMIFSELKCGFNPLFLKLYTITHYETRNNTASIQKEFDSVKEYISRKDAKTLHQLLKENDIDGFHEIIRRDYYTLRWTISEVLKEKKRLPNNKSISLRECVGQKTLIKIDCFAPIKFSYRELSTLYFVSYEENGEEQSLTPSNEYFPMESIKQVEYYMNQQLFTKAIKRIYMLCKFVVEHKAGYGKYKKEACDLLRRLDSIINTEAFALSRVKTECEDIQKIVGLKTNKTIYKTIFFQILAFNARILDSIEPMGEYRKNLKNDIAKYITELAETFFTRVVVIDKDGSYDVKTGRLNEKIKGLTEEYNKVLEPSITILIKKTMEKHKLNPNDLVEFAHKIKE